MSTLETNLIQPATGTTLTVGASGDTVTVPSGATINLSNATQTGVGGTNTPAFEAYLGDSGGQSVTNNAVTLVEINTEVYDTDSAFDTGTYRFTPQTAGKYFVYASIQLETGSNANLDDAYLYIKKSGTQIYESTNIFASNYIRQNIISGHIVVDMNGSSDYLELFGRILSVSGSGQLFEGDPQWKRATHFGAYKLII